MLPICVAVGDPLVPLEVLLGEVLGELVGEALQDLID